MRVYKVYKMRNIDIDKFLIYGIRGYLFSF